MASLLSGRQMDLKLEKRAVFGKDKILEILNKCVEEKIPTYMLFYAYEGKQYSIVYSYENGIQHCGYSLVGEDANIIEYNSVEDLVNNLPIEHEITALYENIFHTGLQTNMNFDIDSNYIVKDYVIDKENPKYGYNMSEELENLMLELTKEAKEGNKSLYILLGGCVAFLVLFFTLMAIFVWSK